MQADTALINGNIITINPSKPQAQAVAIKNKRIIKVGKNREIRPLMKENTKVIDLKGKTFLPRASQTLPAEQEKLFNKDSDTLNKMIQNLFKQAYPDLKDVKITWHDFRRLYVSTASNLGINQWHVKMLIGKQVPPDMLPYLRNLDLKSDFTKIKANLTIQPKTNATPLKEMINVLSEVLLELVRDKLAEKGITLERKIPANWHKLYEKLEKLKIGSM